MGNDKEYYVIEGTKSLDSLHLIKSMNMDDKKKKIVTKKNAGILAGISGVLSVGYFFLPHPVIPVLQGVLMAVEKLWE